MTVHFGAVIPIASGYYRYTERLTPPEIAYKVFQIERNLNRGREDIALGMPFEATRSGYQEYQDVRKFDPTFSVEDGATLAYTLKGEGLNIFDFDDDDQVVEDVFLLTGKEKRELDQCELAAFEKKAKELAPRAIREWKMDTRYEYAFCSRLRRTVLEAQDKLLRQLIRRPGVVTEPGIVVSEVDSARLMKRSEMA